MTRSAHLAFEHATVLTPDGHCILDSVTLSISPGERLALLGPSGAGKTTLLRLARGTLTPTAGKVWLDGCSVADLPAADRSRLVAALVQHDAPDPRLSVADYVALGRIPHHGRVPAAADRRAVGKALGSLGLEDLARRQHGTLSGAERQRAALARAIAQEPSLLLLDEPMNHLGPRERFSTLALTRELGITAIAVLQDLTLVSAFANRVAALKSGRLVALGETQRVLASSAMRDVFGTDCFPVTSPVSGRDLLIFDQSAA